MNKLLEFSEEQDIREKYIEPRTRHIFDGLYGNKKTAYDVIVRKPDDILLIGGMELAFGATVAGLTEAMAEMLLKNGTKSQREGLRDFLSDEDAFHEAMKTAEDMDDDEEERSTKHRERVARVIQYLRDNSVVLGN